MESIIQSDHIHIIFFFTSSDPLLTQLTTSLALSWTIIKLDKAVDNELWMQTTHYYWRLLSLQLTVGLADLLALFTTTFLASHCGFCWS